MSAIDPVTQITEAIGNLVADNDELRESLQDVRASLDFEDRNWVSILGRAAGDNVEGLDLDELKIISEKARTKVAAASLEKRASDLHGGYVFGKGVEIEGVLRDPSKTGRPPAQVRFFEDVINQENLFSDGAMKELQRARFTDGNIVVLCDTRTKQVRRLPLKEITAVMTNPDFSDEIWAWQRTWDHHTAGGETVPRSAWVYTNRFKGVRKKSIPQGNGLPPVPVMENTTAVDLRANRQVGWVYGVPDATAGMLWTEAYGEVLRYGQIVNESLAKIVYKVIQKTKKGAQSAGVRLGTPSQAGGAAVVGEGQDIQLVNSSQRSFDFTAARPLAAMAATAWNISNIDLLADSSAAGSSYGAAQSLTEGVRNAMVGMQRDWSQLYQDIFEVFDFGRVNIFWPPIETPDPYREAQELTLYSVALSDEEYRAAVLDRLDIAGDASKIPPSLEARTVTAKQAASPDQGQNSPAGGTDSTMNNDQRTDGIGEALRAMQQSDLLSEFRSLVERMEAVKAD